MRKVIAGLLKYGVLIFIITISSLALFTYYTGAGFDPVREIERLKDQRHRDEALDLARFFSSIQNGRNEKLQNLQKNLQYTSMEKYRSFLWDGIVKGDVHDSYSGVGALGSDLFIIGDIRDVGIQSWKYLVHAPDYDKWVLIMAAAGVGLSGTSFVNGCDSLAKNTVKYLRKLPEQGEKGVLKEFVSGGLPKTFHEPVWKLLKKTTGPSPKPPVFFPA